MIAMADIDRMGLTERLLAMEMLWQSLSATPASIASPPWHAEVLADRQARADAGQARFLSLQEAKGRLSKG